jgi:toxin YoeB
MEVKFKAEALTDRDYWKSTGDIYAQKKITGLLAEIAETPYRGAGRPEPLKYNLKGYWSRRINKEHRIIYKVDERRQIVTVHSLRGHYDK